MQMSMSDPTIYGTVIKQGDRLLISVQKKHYPRIQGLKGKLCKITIEPLEGE